MAGSDFGPANEEELRGAQQSKKQRKADFIEVLKRAGLDPAGLDISMVMSDETRVRAIRQQAARKEAHELAKEVGRQGLRDRLKRTVEQQTSKIVEPEDLGLPKSSRNGTHSDSADGH